MEKLRIPSLSKRDLDMKSDLVIETVIELGYRRIYSDLAVARTRPIKLRKSLVLEIAKKADQ